MKVRQLFRNLFILLLALACLGGLAYLWIAPPKSLGGRSCQRIAISIQTEQGGEALFLTPARVEEELSLRGIHLKGRPLDSIDLRQIEQTLLKLPIYKRAEAFTSPASGTIQIRLTEKSPLFLVFEPSGKSYYVTQGKDTFGVSPSFAAYLPVVSGDVDVATATGPVYDLLQTVRQDPYFADYFGQVYVDQEEGISLIPRIGSTRVILGHGADWAGKLRKWRIFAESVLPKRGMNAFSYVNLDYADQIIAAQRYPEEGRELETVTTPATPPQPTPPPAKTPEKPKVKAEPAKKTTEGKTKKPQKEAPKREKPAEKKSAPKAETKKSTKEKSASPKPSHKPASKPTPTSQKKK